MLIEFLNDIQNLQHISSKTGEFGTDQSVTFSHLLQEYINLALFLTLFGGNLQFDKFIDQEFMLLCIFKDLVFLE